MEGWEKRYWDDRARLCGVSAPGYDGGTAHDQKAIDAFEKVADCNVLLDVGCGTGRLYETLTKHCQKYVGIDFSAEMLKLFREHQTLRPQDELFLIDIADGLPFSNGNFDTVISNVVLQHIVDNGKFHKAIMEIKRVLRMGGTCYICECTTPGVLVKQPYPHQRLRPTAMIREVFMPEIDLKDQGEIQSLQHFFSGRKLQLVPETSKVTVDIGSGINPELGSIGIDVRKVYSFGARRTDIMADALHLPLQEKSADAIYCTGLIEHFENPYLLLLEIHRVLKKEGTAYIQMPFAGTASAECDLTHKFKQDGNTWLLILSGFFIKITIMPVGLRYGLCKDEWKEKQKKMWADGFYDMVQGGQFVCTHPRELPELNYIPWWLEEWARQQCGEDLI